MCGAAAFSGPSCSFGVGRLRFPAVDAVKTPASACPQRREDLPRPLRLWNTPSFMLQKGK
jgi:hypothetical protein